MIDLAALKRSAEGGESNEEVPVTRRLLTQVVAEIEAGRQAAAQLGGLLGLHGNKI